MNAMKDMAARAGGALVAALVFAQLAGLWLSVAGYLILADEMAAWQAAGLVALAAVGLMLIAAMVLRNSLGTDPAQDETGHAPEHNPKTALIAMLSDGARDKPLATLALAAVAGYAMTELDGRS